MTILAPYTYLQKSRFQERLITSKPIPSLEMVIVIPAYKEEQLTATLASLEANPFQDKHKIEVIIIINNGIHEEESIQIFNQEVYKECQDWIRKNSPGLTIHPVLVQDLPKKHAGVGLARKIGMDEAVDRLEQVENEQGLIVCLDADSQVQSNYLQVLMDTHLQQPKMEAFSIRFAHPLEGEGYKSEVYEGIILYELFLRYYVEGLRMAGYPYAIHTIGSSMAVRSKAYQKMGGMNRRKAGEDFYFLHKFSPGGKVFEVQETTVIPSPRASDRVPFGTGKAIQGWLDQKEKVYQAYHPAIFQALETFLLSIADSYERMAWDIAPCFESFFENEHILQKGKETKAHVGNKQAYIKRFYQWLTPLKVLQLIRSAAVTYPDVPLEEAVEGLFSSMVPEEKVPNSLDPKAWLLYLRKRQAER
ncbi:MAG: glycosyltransferase family 2 protein [Bacteroidota bacterium]